MKFIVTVLVFLTLVSCAHDSKKDNCSTVGECLDVASKLTGKSYLYDDMTLKEKVGSIGTVTWDKENADLLIGELLSSAGYYRLDMGKNVYKLIYARDVRYASGVKSYSANKESNDELPPPNAADPVELVYVSKNGGDRASDIARNLRPFMSRYGRVIDQRSGGLVIVRDTASAINQLLPLIRKMDTPMSAEEKKSKKNSGSMEEFGEKIRGEVMKKFNEVMEKNPRPKKD